MPGEENQYSFEKTMFVVEGILKVILFVIIICLIIYVVWRVRKWALSQRYEEIWIQVSCFCLTVLIMIRNGFHAVPAEHSPRGGRLQTLTTPGYYYLDDSGVITRCSELSDKNCVEIPVRLVATANPPIAKATAPMEYY